MQSHQRKKNTKEGRPEYNYQKKKTERHEKENEGQRRKSSQRFNTDLRLT